MPKPDGGGAESPAGLIRIREEQRRCRDWLRDNPDHEGRTGAVLGLSDWLMEEVIFCDSPHLRPSHSVNSSTIQQS